MCLEHLNKILSKVLFVYIYFNSKFYTQYIYFFINYWELIIIYKYYFSEKSYVLFFQKLFCVLDLNVFIITFSFPIKL